MSISTQIPRTSIIWLLVAQFAVIAIHAPRLSWWMIVIWMLCAAWRMAMLRGEARYPGVLLRLVLIAMGCVGIAAEFGSLGSLDVAVALLILAFSLKLIEVKDRRDLFVVLYLAYFLVAAGSLFSQAIGVVAYQLACVVLITTAMVATQQGAAPRSGVAALRTAALLLGQAVPLMLVFFIVFPRIEPLWAVPSSEAQGGTGMSDSMSPGDVASLAKSGEVAFRVAFDGAVPATPQLYWRGSTLSYFDGRRWTARPQQDASDDAQSSLLEDSWQTAAQASATQLLLYGESIRYHITQEPSQQRWVFALPIASGRAQAGTESSLVATNDLSLRTEKPLFRRASFSVESWPQYQAEPSLSASRYRNETALPAEGNPRARALARRWFEEAGSSRRYIARVLAHFSEQPFYYTLQPPVLGEDTVDEFLFDSRRGFCEHYANAFTFLMRAAGVPARVVVGYQGGELNPYSNALVVRQMDAHAWTEVWRAGLGWQRVDPTAAVAPSRVEHGLEYALEERDEQLGDSVFSPLRYRNVALLSWARLQIDAINYRWNAWFVNFDARRQLLVLRGLLGEISPLRLALAVTVALVMVMGVVALSLLWHRFSQPLAPETRLYRQFCRKCEALGMARGPGEAPSVFAARVSERYPHLHSEVHQITTRFQAIAYAERRDPLLLKEYRRAVQRFRPSARRAA